MSAPKFKALPTSQTLAASNTTQQSKSDRIPAYLTGGTIKLFANILRLAFYCHYKLYPNQRFQIESTKELRSIRHQVYCYPKKRIPRIIWQTNYTDKVSLAIKAGWLCNRLLSPGYDYKFHTTEMCKDFVEHHFPGETSRLYSRLTIGAAQADLWRLLVLYKHGGVYMDIDAHLIWPLDRLITPVTSDLFLYHRKNRKSTNYFIASEPGNPTLKFLINETLKRIEKAQKKSVYQLTGPGVFQHILPKRAHTWRYSCHTCMQGNFSDKFFQYLDNPAGHWKTLQRLQRVVRIDDN